MVRKSRARSQADFGFEKMWTWQSWPATVIAARSSNSASAGFTDSVSPLKIGMKVSAASRQPATMMLLRPMRSLSLPKNTKKGVPTTSAAAISA